MKMATQILSPKQQKFIDAFSLSGNISEAARLAGYSERSARQIGQETLRIPAVQVALAARQADYAAEFQITKNDVIAGVLSAINMARSQENPAAMVAGCTTLCRMLGFFNPEIAQEVGPDTAPIKARMAALSDADLLAMDQGRS